MHQLQLLYKKKNIHINRWEEKLFQNIKTLDYSLECFLREWSYLWLPMVHQKS